MSTEKIKIYSLKNKLKFNIESIVYQKISCNYAYTEHK